MTTNLGVKGLRSLPISVQNQVYLPIWNTLTSRRPIGTNVFDLDWDLLIILDTCRVDELRRSARKRPWLGNVGEIRSVGSMSAEWMLNTFTQHQADKIGETAFVSGNIWSHRIFEEQFHEHTDHGYDMVHCGIPKWDPVSAETFAHYETVSAVANQNDPLHPKNDAIPHVLTDRTIAVAREHDFDRLIVHYTLPHLTFIADALDWSSGELTMMELMNGPEPVRDLRPAEVSYDPARQGKVKTETVRKHYRGNLQLALDYVEILLQNIDAEQTIISADHGEALGELGVWGHPFGYPFSPVKTVPWASTTATDEGTYDPCYDSLERMPTESEREEFLKAMGYL
ncbi:hypothetical protein G9464_01235 [Halostella sp. JP-L12]|uniref:hypothetical protein n=1 Tax=Halostella TaxID=1843185 RepID=UPI0013CF1C42|nr:MULTISPECIES: hypothetical protein [Halostella]NHN46223.1 hypothetical protein [Halostella sp. JP-L12]